MGSFPTEKHPEMQEILENGITSPKVLSEQNTMVIHSLAITVKETKGRTEKSRQESYTKY